MLTTFSGWIGIEHQSCRQLDATWYAVSRVATSRAPVESLQRLFNIRRIHVYMISCEDDDDSDEVFVGDLAVPRVP